MQRSIGEEKCMYLLYNFKEIRDEFSKMDKSDEEYGLTKKYINTVLTVYNTIKRDVDTPIEIVSRTFKGNKREFYCDIIWVSFLTDKKLSSEAMLSIINKKYDTDLSVIELAKLKRKAVRIFARYYEKIFR